METEEFSFLIVAAGIIISSIVLPPLIKIKQNAIGTYLKAYPVVYNFFDKFIFNHIVLIIILMLVTELLIYKIYKKVVKARKIKQEIEYKTNKELDYVDYFLKVDLKSLEYKQLSKLYNRFKNDNFSYVSLLDYDDEIELKLKKIENRLIELEHKQELESIDYKIRESKEELEEINEEILKKQVNEELKREKTIRRLSIGHKEVFKASHLTPKEKEIAKEEGYHAVNEYCVLENKIISVLVKPPMNHSPTHTFLVWSVRRLLNKFPKIERIMEHETRDADLTFRIKTKNYAIEIEKGSLLRKKGQLMEKVEYLDDRYQDRWLILVSNKNMAKKYREFGKVATRKDFRKKIEKWVKESEIRKNSAKN